jgi:hypothetical protein
MMSNRNLAMFCTLVGCLLFSRAGSSQAGELQSQPVVVSAQFEGGSLLYRVNGKRVEDTKRNSLLVNLGSIAEARGTKVSVFIIVDVRASFVEIGKLETALDKVGMTSGRRIFVTDFRDATMNEIHWDETPIPIPRN